MGLISNVALNSLGTLRANTHRIIQKFNSSIDASYLTHRTLVSPIEEAESHVIPLIVSEIEGVLEDCNVSDYLSIKYIKQWLERHISYCENTPLYRRMQVKSKSEAKTAMEKVLTKGVINGRTKKNKKWRDRLNSIKCETDKDALSQFTNILTVDGSSGEKSDQELALLMSMKTRYECPTPKMPLGSVTY